MVLSTLFQIPSAIHLFTFALSNLVSVSAFTQCYYPDGSIPTDYIWEPCTGDEFSSCCVPSEGDICQPNGLCYYQDTESVYRGTCTDRTWNSPSCPTDICVTGFESTWIWAISCQAGDSSSSSYECGTLDSDGTHEVATCAGSAATNTVGIVTTRSRSSAGRYTAPASLDPALYSVYIQTYTTIITANLQTTTFTSTFESTFTTAIGESAAATSSTSPTSTGTTKAATAKKGVTLGVGVLAAIIAIPILALIGAVVLYCLIRKRSSKKDDAIRLDSSANYPPPNGPVGADQVYPYEVPATEAPVGYQHNYAYKAPKIDAYEIDDQAAMLREKSANKMGIGGGNHEYMEVRSPISPRSPAPAYAEALIPVELDGTSSLRTPSVRTPSRGYVPEIGVAN